jgi:hypothetical protein
MSAENLCNLDHYTYVGDLRQHVVCECSLQRFSALMDLS